MSSVSALARAVVDSHFAECPIVGPPRAEYAGLGPRDFGRPARAQRLDLRAPQDDAIGVGREPGPSERVSNVMPRKGPSSPVGA